MLLNRIHSRHNSKTYAFSSDTLFGKSEIVSYCFFKKPLHPQNGLFVVGFHFVSVGLFSFRVDDNKDNSKKECKNKD